MNYEGMSWLEINHAVAEIVEPSATQIQESRFNAFDGDFAVEVFVDDDIVEYDFSKPSDAWGIIVENLIDVLSPLYRSGKWEATAFTKCDELVSSLDKNPLRAAMICFLKMKDAEK